MKTELKEYQPETLEGLTVFLVSPLGEGWMSYGPIDRIIRSPLLKGCWWRMWGSWFRPHKKENKGPSTYYYLDVNNDIEEDQWFIDWEETLKLNHMHRAKGGECKCPSPSMHLDGCFHKGRYERINVTR